MPTMKPNPAATRPAFNNYADFAIPATFALISPSHMSMSFARLYVPNPWRPSEIRFYDYVLTNGLWCKNGGSTFPSVEDARANWRLLISEKWTPQNVIVNPLNGNRSGMDICDMWAAYFAGYPCFFSDLVRHYGDYPRKAV